MKRWHAWLELARISNLPTVWTNVLAGGLLAGGAWHWAPLGWLLGGGSLLYTAGMILNDAMDARFDREHRQERPIPSGRVPASTAWGVGGAMLIAGAAMCFFGAGACGWLVLALVVAILAYDAFHKPWAGSVLIMGSCRTLLYLVAGSAVTGGLSWETNHELVVKAVALGAYIVGVSLVARSESRSSGPKYGTSVIGSFCLCLPVAALGTHWVWWRSIWPVLLWLAASLAIAITLPESQKQPSQRGCFDKWFRISVWVLFSITAIGSVEDWGKVLPWLPLVLCLGVVLWVIERAIKLMRTPPSSNIGRAVGLLLAGIVVVDGLAISFLHPIIALVFAASMPLLLLWQRKIAAT